jgi:hypothetical protein
LQTTPEHNASIKVKHKSIFANRGKNALGLASLEGTRAMIRALLKLFNVSLGGLGHLLLGHLELLFLSLWNCYWVLLV